MSPVYEFHCDNCKQRKEVYSSMQEKHWAFCSKCKCEMRRIFGNTVFKIHGYSPGNDLKQDAIDQKIHKALTDESPVTKTMQEIGAEQVIKRAERRGEDTNKALHEVFGGKKGVVTSKESMAKETKRQRNLIDNK